MMIPFVSYLVGRGLGWEELKKKQFFQIPKISRKEDIKVLIFTPNVNRETVIWAKFAAAFTYFMGINFFLTLFGLIYFLFVAKFGIISSCLFLLLNGLGLALVNFLLLIPFLFYQQESGSVLASILLSFFIFFLIFSLFLLRSFVLQYPIIFMIASVPFAILVGYFFFSCYWKSFLSKDLE
ncbi:MAG: ABC-2 transporter permease [Spiroplasmataceae bacterium]|nr:ABC-2 transporter permease [Spiroplasmataceae bacterium]